ncbi:MAG: hypothetical protein WD824_17685, partial [Cyclobacteriaceae bacterium]
VIQGVRYQLTIYSKNVLTNPLKTSKMLYLSGNQCEFLSKRDPVFYFLTTSFQNGSAKVYFRITLSKFA